MRYFLDTEFIETGQTIDLISVALVSEDGREFYAISTEFDETRADTWVRENVLLYLPTKDTSLGLWMPRSQIRDGILAFIGEDKNPEFWAYYADYDWVVFCWLFGRMIDLPNHFPRYCRDLKQELDRIGNPHVPFKPTTEHVALSDAHWNKQLYDWLMQA